MPESRARLVRWAAPLMIAMNVVWGASYLAADIGIREMGVGRLATWRFIVASALLFPMMLATRTPIRIQLRDLWRIAFIGLVAVAGNYVLTYRGIQLASSTDRAVVSPLEPVALAIMSWMFLRERLTRRQWLGIAVACSGAYLLVEREAFSGAGWNPRHSVGVGMMLLSFVTEGTYSIVGKPLLGRYRPLTVTAWSMVVASIFLYAGMCALGQPPAPPRGVVAWNAVLFLAVPCTVVGYTLWYMLLEHMPAGVLGNYIFVQPAVGVALGVLYRGAPVTTFLVGGGVLIALGVWLTGSSSAADPIPDPEPSA